MMMDKKTIIVKGKQPYLYDAEFILSVSCVHDSKTLSFSFSKETKKLQIFDNYKNQQEYMYGKNYRVHYIIDKQILREQQIKKILDEDRM